MKMIILRQESSELVWQVLVAKQVTAMQKEQLLILVTAVLTIAAPTTAAPAPVADSISLCFRCTFGFPCTVWFFRKKNFFNFLQLNEQGEFGRNVHLFIEVEMGVSSMSAL